MMREKRWRVSAPAMLTVNSIFAALSAFFIALVLQGKESWGQVEYSLALLSAATFLFVLTAEKITEALDDDDVYKHVAYMAPYNFAVSFFFIAVAFLIDIKYRPSRCWEVILTLGAICYWVYDAGWLLFAGREKFDDYVAPT